MFKTHFLDFQKVLTNMKAKTVIYIQSLLFNFSKLKCFIEKTLRLFYLFLFFNFSCYVGIVGASILCSLQKLTGTTNLEQTNHEVQSRTAMIITTLFHRLFKLFKAPKRQQLLKLNRVTLNGTILWTVV